MEVNYRWPPKRYSKLTRMQRRVRYWLAGLILGDLQLSRNMNFIGDIGMSLEDGKGFWFCNRCTEYGSEKYTESVKTILETRKRYDKAV